ncbi:MAG TPA: tRNA (adenosine(37)-N6)-threonylcarbamoyltransferase complex ATPase subunit type 1 TsaE [Bdellovibrionales bacterium]|nr:tRNA (adenosine(37)-N6)-threonylcarbamoyltransferase complex ATPase subunit type 1 TsaE [Bdellovibrionales bacterium]
MSRTRTTTVYGIQNETEFKELAARLARQMRAPLILLLNGPMGAGKTLWVRSTVETLGGKWVSSPSFAVIQRYAVDHGTIDHVDLFRLKNDRDLESTGFWDLLDDRKTMIFVEWADRLPQDVWPPTFNLWSVSIEIKGAGRVVTVTS